VADTLRSYLPLTLTPRDPRGDRWTDRQPVFEEPELATPPFLYHKTSCGAASRGGTRPAGRPSTAFCLRHMIHQGRPAILFEISSAHDICLQVKTRSTVCFHELFHRLSRRAVLHSRHKVNLFGSVIDSGQCYFISDSGGTTSASR
jgi:hypothetical protein